MDGLEPFGEGNVGTLEDRARPNRKLLATVVALVETLPLTIELRDLAQAAERASSAIRPPEGFEVLTGLFFVQSSNNVVKRHRVSR